MSSNSGTGIVDEGFTPAVSVIVPVYNGEAELPALVSCLLAQTYPHEQVEYLLVDNGSRDRTPQLLQQAIQTGAEQGVTIRHLSETQIQSSYAARNTGIRAASADILAFTDADCRPLPTWLHTLIQPFQESTVGVVAGEVIAFPGKTLLERFADRRETLSQKHTLGHAFLPYGQTANLAIRRQALEQAGLFRPHLSTGGDADLCWRIQQQGSWQIRFAEQAIVQHQHRTSLKELRRQWQRYGRSNRYLHELHGVSLMREPTLREYVYRWSRWLGKEVPSSLQKILIRRASLSDLLDTPLDLMCIRSRALGQRQAVLPELARQIDWLPQASAKSAADAVDILD